MMILIIQCLVPLGRDQVLGKIESPNADLSSSEARMLGNLNRSHLSTRCLRTSTLLLPTSTRLHAQVIVIFYFLF